MGLWLLVINGNEYETRHKIHSLLLQLHLPVKILCLVSVSLRLPLRFTFSYRYRYRCVESETVTAEIILILFGGMPYLNPAFHICIFLLLAITSLPVCTTSIHIETGRDSW